MAKIEEFRERWKKPPDKPKDALDHHWEAVFDPTTREHRDHGIGKNVEGGQDRNYTRCRGCYEVIDPETCYCRNPEGDGRTAHAEYHAFTPMVCRCKDNRDRVDTPRYIPDHLKRIPPTPEEFGKMVIDTGIIVTDVSRESNPVRANEKWTVSFVVADKIMLSPYTQALLLAFRSLTRPPF